MKRKPMTEAKAGDALKNAFSKEVLTTIAQTLEEKAESERYVVNPAVLDAWAAVAYHLYRFHDVSVERYVGSQIEERLIALGKRDNVKV